MWRVGVDSGGTFTDVCLVDDETGEIHVWKVPGTPADPAEAIASGVVEGLDAAAGVVAAAGHLGHGTTVATNARVQHRGVTTGLITTGGFRDLLEIGRQRRPHLCDLQADTPPVLVPRARRHEAAELQRRRPAPRAPGAGPRGGGVSRHVRDLLAGRSAAQRLASVRKPFPRSRRSSAVTSVSS